MASRFASTGWLVGREQVVDVVRLDEADVHRHAAVPGEDRELRLRRARVDAPVAVSAGLAAYAASAIAKSAPIRTGVEGFAYDLRRALLPFMFVFNTELLLLRYVGGSFVRITSWPEILVIFGTGGVAMLAFAALTQNYFAARNRFHEALLLLLVTAILLRPGFFADRLGWGTRYVWSR